MNVNLSEAFTKLKLIESEDFDLLNKDEKESFSEFLNETEESDDAVVVFDTAAVDEEELEDSYLGKIVCQCPVCKSLVFKGWDEYEEMDEEVSCPYCFSVEHFDTIGKIVPIEDETKEEIEVKEPVEEVVEESCDTEPVQESLETVTVETDNEVINISSEEKSEACEECEEPVEEHETVEVIAPLEEPELSEAEEPKSEEITEVDEESFDEMAESWLKENYKNIKSYRTIRFTESKRTIGANGIVVLENGDKKRTTFVIRPGRLDESYRTKVVVENLELGIKKTIKGQLK